IVRKGAGPLEQISAIRADQYGIRTGLRVDGHDIKFEIVLRALQDAESAATGQISVSMLLPE
ncbi:nucleotidyl transferase AbiEii/AbiGii toxin family protein, partial [Roseateles sp. GG27B]